MTTLSTRRYIPATAWTALGHPASGWVAAVVSGALLAISRETGHWGWLVLAAPVPLLVFALRTQQLWLLAGLAFATGLVGEAGIVYFYGQLLPVVVASMVVVQALAYMAGVLFFRAVWRRWPVLAVPAYACFVVALEYLVARQSPNGSFGAWGYTLVDVPVLLQAASLGGLAALSALAVGVPAGLATLFMAPRRAAVQGLWMLPVAASLAFGAWQLQQPAAGTLKVALLTDDRQIGQVEHDPARALAVANALAQPLQALVSQRPDVVLLPEKLFTSANDGLFQRLSAGGTAIVAGLDEAGEGGRRNLARLYRAGQSAASYAKQHMIPGLEGAYAPGTQSLVTTIRAQPVGLAVCKDMDFAPTLRAYGQQGVRLLLVPAWDFGADARLHGRMAVVRGVENGFAVARAASQGLMTLSDAHGQVVAEASSAPRPASLVAELPLGSGQTLYSRIGDLPAQLGLVLCAVVMLGLLVGKPCAAA